jgi:hypothetical protein
MIGVPQVMRGPALIELWLSATALPALVVRGSPDRAAESSMNLSILFSLG